MKTIFSITIVLLSLSFGPALGQKVNNTNKKETQARSKLVELKDTTVYVIITEAKDTFYFGSDRKMKIPEGDSSLTSVLRINNKSLDILVNGKGAAHMAFHLNVTKHINDTIPVFSPFDLTQATLRIEKIYYCDIKGLQINNYKAVRQNAYTRRCLVKLIDFADE